MYVVVVVSSLGSVLGPYRLPNEPVFERCTSEGTVSRREKVGVNMEVRVGLTLFVSDYTRGVAPSVVRHKHSATHSHLHVNANYSRREQPSVGD